MYTYSHCKSYLLIIEQQPSVYNGPFCYFLRWLLYTGQTVYKLIISFLNTSIYRPNEFSSKHSTTDMYHSNADIQADNIASVTPVGDLINEDSHAGIIATMTHNRGSYQQELTRGYYTIVAHDRGYYQRGLTRGYYSNYDS